MKILLILAASFLSGCAIQSFPDFPAQIKNHYAIDIRGEEINPVLKKFIVNLDDVLNFKAMSGEKVTCLKFEIMQHNPYKIAYIGTTSISECNGVGGYKPSDTVQFYNFLQDIYRWAEGRKKCLLDNG